MWIRRWDVLVRDCWVLVCLRWVRKLLEKIVVHCSAHEALRPFSILFLLAYSFLLRLPSHALPVVASAVGAARGRSQATLCIEGSELVLYLRKRKNKPQGSRLARSCWCSECTTTCPLRVIGKFMSEQPGLPLFPGITAHSALVALRMCLLALATPSAADCGTHDLRRGHTLDLQCSGTC